MNHYPNNHPQANFSLRVYQRDFSAPLTPPGLNYQVERYTWAAQGGPESALIKAWGAGLALWELADLLRCPLEIIAPDGEAVWWGFVQSVTVQTGALRVTLSLKNCFNRLAVAYSSPGSSPPVGMTAWVEDENSVHLYGVRERVLALPGATLSQAEAARDATLAESSWPQPLLEVVPPGEKSQAWLDGLGWWQTLAWRYASPTNAPGSLPLAAGKQHKLGLACSSNQISFDSGSRCLVDNLRTLLLFSHGDQLRVSGSASNNRIFHVNGVRQESVVSSLVSFNATQRQINDGLGRLRFFPTGCRLMVSGSQANDGVYSVTGKEGSSRLTVAETLVDEGEGAQILFKAVFALQVVEVPAGEHHGAQVMLRVVGERLRLPAGPPFRLEEVVLRLGVLGRPVGELVISVYRDKNGLPSEELACANLTPGDIRLSGATVCSLLPKTLVQGGELVWIELSLSTGPAVGGCYLVQIIGDELCPDGELWLFDGADWQPASPPNCLAFSLGLSRQSNDQLVQILTMGGQFFTGIDAPFASQMWRNPWCDGKSTALQEAQSLLDHGRAGVSRLQAYVDSSRTVHLFHAPLPGSEDHLLSADSQLFDPHDRPLPPWRCVCGIWAQLKEAVYGTAVLSRMGDPGRIFIARCEYNAAFGRVIYHPE